MPSLMSGRGKQVVVGTGEGNGSDGLRVAVGEGVGGDENADPSNSIVMSANASMIGVCTLT